MAVRGGSKKTIVTAAVVSQDPHVLCSSYGYAAARNPDGTFTATVGEMPSLTRTDKGPIEATMALKNAVLATLLAMAEGTRPAPLGIANKASIDSAKEVPRHIKKAFGKTMAGQS